MAGKRAYAMTVGMDAKRAVENFTGLGNYSRYAVNILSAAFPSTTFRLYAPRECENDRLRPLLARDNVQLVTANPTIDCGLTRALWRTVDLPTVLKADDVAVYHGLSNELPLTIGGVCPSVVTMHDIIYRRFPSDYGAIDRRIYDYKYSRSARRATRVIAISECTRRDIMADYDIDPAKIDVIYQGIDPVFSLEVDTAARQRVRERYKLPQTFIISVGTVSPRKNQMLAIEALARLPQAVRLVIVGGANRQYLGRLERRAAELGVADRVVRLEGVPLADLPALYSLAAVSSYTSRYEGFGLPVVESLTVGTPAIACTGSCLEEAGGDGAVYVGPDDVDAFAEEAQHIIDDTIYHDRLARHGRAHVRRFSAENFAKATMATYNKAILDFLL